MQSVYEKQFPVLGTNRYKNLKVASTFDSFMTLVPQGPVWLNTRQRWSPTQEISNSVKGRLVSVRKVFYQMLCHDFPFLITANEALSYSSQRGCQLNTIQYFNL